MSTAPPATDPSYKPLPGRLGNLTQQQQEALDKLRSEIEQEGWFVPERRDDAMLLRCASAPSAHDSFHKSEKPFAVLLRGNRANLMLETTHKHYQFIAGRKREGDLTLSADSPFQKCSNCLNVP